MSYDVCAQYWDNEHQPVRLIGRQQTIPNFEGIECQMTMHHKCKYCKKQFMDKGIHEVHETMCRLNKMRIEQLTFFDYLNKNNEIYKVWLPNGTWSMTKTKENKKIF